jgi:hypothetical protein
MNPRFANDVIAPAAAPSAKAASRRVRAMHVAALTKEQRERHNQVVFVLLNAGANLDAAEDQDKALVRKVGRRGVT